MPDHEGRFDWISTVALTALLAALVLVGLGLVFLATAYVLTAMDTENWYQPVRFWLAAALLAAIPVLFVAYGLVRAAVAGERNAASSAGRLARIETLLDSQNRSLGELVELAGLSDSARSLINRDQEVLAVREAVQEHLMRQDYDTALALADGVETKMGYIDEARRLREQVGDTRKASTEEKIDSAIRRIEELVRNDHWAPALRAARKLLAVFPNHPKAQALPAKIEAQRSAQKRDLLQQYSDAVAKNDVDSGVEILRQLDKYLTPQEAGALEESARGVFRAKLHNLGVQFAIHVADQAWSKAVSTGEEIIRSYPNSRMAHEVRQKMDQLKARAATQQEKA